MPDRSSSHAHCPFPLLMAPPPLVFLAAFVAGMAIEQIVPFAVGPVPATIRVAGLVLLVAGIAFGASLAVMFLSRKTTLNPFASPRAFVVVGAYRFSRNPMYLALISAYLGGALLYGSIWPLLLLLLPVTTLRHVVIPHEEAVLSATFGTAYDDYRTRVRRWL